MLNNLNMETKTKQMHMNIEIAPRLVKQAKTCALDLGISLKEYVKQAIEEKIQFNTGNYPAEEEI